MPPLAFVNEETTDWRRAASMELSGSTISGLSFQGCSASVRRKLRKPPKDVPEHRKVFLLLQRTKNDVKSSPDHFLN